MILLAGTCRRLALQTLTASAWERWLRPSSLAIGTHLLGLVASPSRADSAGERRAPIRLTLAIVRARSQHSR